MFKKGRLTKVIEDRMCEGDSVIPQFNRHLTTALFISKLTCGRSRVISETINLVVASPQRRSRLLQELAENLRPFASR